MIVLRSLRWRHWMDSSNSDIELRKSGGMSIFARVVRVIRAAAARDWLMRDGRFADHVYFIIFVLINTYISTVGRRQQWKTRAWSYPVLLPDGQVTMRESARCCVMTKKRTVTLSLLYAVKRALHCAHPFAAIQFRRKKELSMKKTIQERHPAVAKVLNDLREGRNTFSIFAR